MITLSTAQLGAPAVRVDWIWTVSVERVLEGPPDLLNWAN